MRYFFNDAIKYSGNNVKRILNKLCGFLLKQRKKINKSLEENLHHKWCELGNNWEVHAEVFLRQSFFNLLSSYSDGKTEGFSCVVICLSFLCNLTIHNYLTLYTFKYIIVGGKGAKSTNIRLHDMNFLS